MLKGWIAGQIQQWLESQPDDVLLDLIQQEVLPRLTLEQKVKLGALVNAEVTQTQQTAEEWRARAMEALEAGHGR